MTNTTFISNQERPRERLLAYGPDTLTNAELLAIILGTGVRGQNAIDFSAYLIQYFGGLRDLLAADETELKQIKGLGKAKICQIKAIQELASRSLSEQLNQKNVLNNSQVVKEYCANKLGHLKIEHCIALYLDNQYRLICSEEISQGTINQTSVYPREIVKAALKYHATAIILAHNHPSGQLKASTADLVLTQHVKEALQLIDVKLLDHLIVCAGKTISLAEQNQI